MDEENSNYLDYLDNSNYLENSNYLDISKEVRIYGKNQNYLLKQLRLYINQKWKNCKQLLGVTFYIFTWVILPIMSMWLPFYILFTSFWWISVLYGCWYVYDFNTPSKGSRKWPAFRRFILWKWFAEYFPAKVVKTCDLPGDKNYILGCHPHGVFSIGAFTALCTDVNGFDKLYPELDPTILTLNGQFYFPFRREIGEWLGGCEVSKKSLTWLLKNPGKGRIIGIVIGGAEEALDSWPGTHNLNLLSRKGFCNFAIKTGASIVPSYSFGENDVYDQTVPNPRGSKIRKIQSMIKKKFGLCPPFFSGRGILTNVGILPYKRPITTVIGAPIDVPHEPEPSQKTIDDVHKQYCDALNELFEKHKKNYGIDDDVHLTYVF